MDKLCRSVGKGRLSLGLALAAGLAASPAEAADWSLRGHATESLFLSDNLNLGAFNRDAGAITTTSLGLDLAARGKTFDFKLSPGLTIRRELFAASSSRWEYFPSIGASYTKRSKRTTFDLNASLAQATVSSSDLIDDIITQSRGSKFTYSFGEKVSTKVTKRDTLSWSNNLSFVSYENKSSSLVPFSNFSSDFGWEHRLSEIVTGNAGVSVSYYVPESTTARNRLTIRPNGSIAAQLTERLSTTSKAGIFILDEAGSRPSADILFSFDAAYKLKTTGYSFGFGRDIFPGQEGNLLDRYSVKAGVNHQVNDLVSWGASTSYSLQNSGNSKWSRAFVFSPSLNYRFTRDWVSALNYQFAYTKSGSSPVYSNAVTFSITYDKLLIP